MVVADDRQAAEWGTEILKRGGNAVDAAVATAFMMSVTRPHYASIGGGGFLLYCPKPGDEGARPCVVLDYREQAPAAAARDMYLKDGKAVPALSQDGALASGIPGVTAGLLGALDRWGSIPRKTLLSKPIEVAKNGFLFTAHEEGTAADRWRAMNPEARRIFGCGTDDPCLPGKTLKQPDLARTLTKISDEGTRGFYEGEIARKIVDGLHESGGILTMQDLASYRPKFRAPVLGEYFGHEVVAMPPPSSGGAIILQMLGFAERADKQGAFDHGFGSPEAIHALTHAMKLSFADRAKYFGDPDFVHVPLRTLLSDSYLDSRWKTYDPSKSVAVDAGEESAFSGEPTHTTHFSVIDAEGNAVAVTTTINDDYGSGFVPPGTGVVMNDQMDDFSAQPGVPNLFGLVGAEANSIAAKKRPLSSMSPTIVRDLAGNVRMVVGAAGGPKITTSVFLTLMYRMRFGLSITDAVAAPRFHHQWKPDRLRMEMTGFPSLVRERLSQMGYEVGELNDRARVYALERFANGRTWGAPDPRGEGAAVAEALK
jgi:gamma-glutamyltranspeptidase/glutathione hydrolase